MDFFIFSSTPPGSSPWSARSPVDPTSRAEFQNYALEGLINNYFSFFFLSSWVRHSLSSPRNLRHEKEATPKGAWVWLGRWPKSLGSVVSPDLILLVLCQDPISWVFHQDPILLGCVRTQSSWVQHQDSRFLGLRFLNIIIYIIIKSINIKNNIICVINIIIIIIINSINKIINKFEKKLL